VNSYEFIITRHKKGAQLRYCHRALKVFRNFKKSVCARCRSCRSTGEAVPFSFVSRASLRERIVHTWLDVALRLPANSGKFGNDKVMCPFEHALLAKRKGLAVAQEIEVLEHFSNLENISCAHFF
jgi:hypothetical protein